MASQSGQKIRLVKCPKCLKILQEDEDIPVYQCGGCSAILQAKRRSLASNSAGETEGTQVCVEPENNNVSTSSGQNTILPSSPGLSSGQENEMSRDGSIEKQLGELELTNGDETQQQECSLDDSKKIEGEDNSKLESDMAEDVGSEASSASLSVDHVLAAGCSNAEISPEASPVEEKQSQIDYPGNKTSSAYDGSESSSDEREDHENDQWRALEKIRSGKVEMPRYPGNYKEIGANSSSIFSDTRRNWNPNRSLQLEGQGGRLGRQERRHVTEQLRLDMPFYPRESYIRGSPSQDEFDRYSRAHSLQMAPYTMARGWGQGSRFSGEMGGDRRNHGGWYSGQLYSSYSESPQEQPKYPPRWSHEIVSDVEDHHRTRQANHHHELQTRRRVAKRQVRPTAGGAPFVNCYSCSENLQLPVDFLIFKRKHHLLKCGTCNTILSFSLQSRTHLIPANMSSNSTLESPGDRAPSIQEEELPVARGSPLHRLMGYSTVSQVFKASQRPPSV